MKILLIVLGCIFLLGIMASCTKKDNPGQKFDKNTELSELTRADNLEIFISDLAGNARYAYTKVENVRINKDLSVYDVYIALINLDYWQRTDADKSNEWIEKYSNDIAARIAKNGIDDISEIAIFWNDSRNKRKLKMSFEYRDGGFYVSERVGF
jgi:hypothetical protein